MYLKSVTLTAENHSIDLIKNNCYSATLGASRDHEGKIFLLDIKPEIQFQSLKFRPHKVTIYQILTFLDFQANGKKLYQNHF